MKSNRLVCLLGGFLLSVASAQGQTPTSYADSDVLLGFRSSDGTRSYLLNIGPASRYTGGVSTTLALGNTGADLVTVFGLDWYTRIDLNTGTNAVFFSVIGTSRIGSASDPAQTVYSSNPDSAPFSRQPVAAQAQVATSIATLGNSYSANQSTANSPVGLIQSNSTANTYRTFQPGGSRGFQISFDYFDPTNELPPNGTAYFNRLVPGAGAGTLLGNFQVRSDGSVIFSAAAVNTPTPTPTPTVTPTPTPTPIGATPFPTPTPTPTIAPTPTPTPTPTVVVVTPTPTPTPQTRLTNLSTRARVETDQRVVISGFSIQGTATKRILIRATGPSLAAAGISSALMNPQIQVLKDGVTIAANDNWRTSLRSVIEPTGLAPADDRESAVVLELGAGNYTAIVRGVAGTSGIALLEIFEVDDGTVPARLVNLSTRGQVLTGDGVMIAGLAVRGSTGRRVLIRALGPSLAASGISAGLSDPLLTLLDAQGQFIASNDNWQSTQRPEISASGLAPSDPRESAIAATLSPGNYTAIVSGVAGATGIGLIEIFELP